MPPNGTTGKSSSKSNTKSNNKSNAGSSNRNAGPGGGMMGGRGSGGPSRTAPSRSVSSKVGSKSSQSGVSKAQSTTSRIGGPASANRAQANKTFDRGIAGVPGGSNRLGGSLAQKAKSPSFSSLADKGIAGVPGGVNRTGGPLANKSSGQKSPMAGQGTSFKQPSSAKVANDAYTKRYGFQNRVLNNPELAKTTAMSDITDLRRMTGPYDPRDPKYGDWNKQTQRYEKFDPNKPLRRADVDKAWTRYNDEKEVMLREINKNIAMDKYNLAKKRGTPPDLRNPSEIRAQIDRHVDSINKGRTQRYAAQAPKIDPRNTAEFRREISSMLPNTPIPANPSMRDRVRAANRAARQLSGDAIYGPKPFGSGDLFRRGGLVKKPKKSPPKKKR